MGDAEKATDAEAKARPEEEDPVVVKLTARLKDPDSVRAESRSGRTSQSRRERKRRRDQSGVRTLGGSGLGRA